MNTMAAVMTTAAAVARVIARHLAMISLVKALAKAHMAAEATAAGVAAAHRRAMAARRRAITTVVAVRAPARARVFGHASLLSCWRVNIMLCSALGLADGMPDGFGKGYGGGVPPPGAYGKGGGPGWGPPPGKGMGGWGGGGWGGPYDGDYGKGGGSWGGFDGGYGKGGAGWGGFDGAYGKGGGFDGGYGKGGGGRGGGGRGPPDMSHGAPPHDYTRMEGDTAPVDVDRVNELLSRRVGAKRARDFRAADAIRNELKNALSVAVLDREKEWHVIVNEGLGRPDGGGTGPYGGYGGAHNMSERFGETGHDYTRADDGTAPIDEAKVNELLAARLHARLNRDFVAADRMRDQLRQECGVEVADQERSWRVVAPEPESGGGGGGGGGGVEVASSAPDDRERYDDHRRKRNGNGEEEAEDDEAAP